MIGNNRGPEIYRTCSGCWRFTRVFRLWLWCLTFGTFPAFATLGVGIISQGFVVVAIDSQITNFLSGRLECKMSHNGTTAIIASGTYRFYEVPRTGLTKIGIVPDVRMDQIVPENFWSIKVGPNQSVESAVVEKARRFIKLGMKVLPGVSEPISIAVINRAGFRFADKGSCESGAQ